MRFFIVSLTIIYLLTFGVSETNKRRNKKFTITMVSYNVRSTWTKRTILQPVPFSHSIVSSRIHNARGKNIFLRCENAKTVREKYATLIHVIFLFYSPRSTHAPVKMIRRSGENARKNSIALKFRKHDDVNIKKERNSVTHFVKNDGKSDALEILFFFSFTRKDIRDLYRANFFRRTKY